MNNSLYSLLILFFAAGFAVLWTGCGRKAPPSPPEVEMTVSIRDLTASKDGGRLQLACSFPENLDKPENVVFIVMRDMKSDLSRCKCPPAFEPVARLKKTEPDAIRYSETLKHGYRYAFKIHIVKDGRLIGQSNTVEAYH